jgi:hypothetical protein
VGKGSFSTVAVALAFAGLGCYGQTDPATDVHPNGATLQARGTADNGPASSYFEYWKSSAPAQKTRTAIKQAPAGASGPISAQLQFLTQNTSYSFRVCGWDGQEPEPPASVKCAQTRTFATPSGDAVDAQMVYDSRFNSGLQIHAWSRPDGTARPRPSSTMVASTSTTSTGA